MTRRIPTPHDHFFRQAMSQKEVAQAFFEVHLPAEIRKAVDLNTLTLRKESFIDEALKEAITDILFSANFLGHPGYIYLLTEHRSTPWRWLPLQVLKYIIRILEQHCNETKDEYLPVVYPLVFYHGKTPYPEPTALLDLFNDPLGVMESVVLNPFHLIDVGQIPDEALRQHVWLSVLELCTKHIFAREFLPYLRKELMGMLRQVVESGGENYVIAALAYLLNAAKISDKSAFIKLIQEGLPPNIGERIMTIAQQLKAEGKMEGEAIGLEKGQKAIARKMLQRGMEVKAISELTDLPLAEVQALADSLKH